MAMLISSTRHDEGRRAYPHSNESQESNVAKEPNRADRWSLLAKPLDLSASPRNRVSGTKMTAAAPPLEGTRQDTLIKAYYSYWWENPRDIRRLVFDKLVAEVSTRLRSPSGATALDLGSG